LQGLVSFMHGWMQGNSWLRSVVAEAPHGIDAVIAACEGNQS
jgi:hypothetical protein